MNKHICIVIVVLLEFFYPRNTIAQTDYFADEEFKSRITLFEDWINRSNLKSVLQIHDFQVLDSTIKVNFYVNDSLAKNSSSKLWKKLTQEYKARNKLSLEYELFYRLIHFLEVQPNQLVIGISDSYNLLDIPCVSGFIKYENGRLINSVSICRSQTSNNKIEDFNLEEEIKKSVVLKSKNLNGDMARRIILEKSDNYFFSRHNTHLIPIQINSDSLLSFRLIEIKEEVFDKSFFQRFNPYEILTFVFFFTEDPDGGVEILGKVYGKYGFGLIKPVSVDKGYRDMEPEYQQKLQDYLNSFMYYKVRLWIEQI